MILSRFDLRSERVVIDLGDVGGPDRFGAGQLEGNLTVFNVAGASEEGAGGIGAEVVDDHAIDVSFGELAGDFQIVAEAGVGGGVEGAIRSGKRLQIADEFSLLRVGGGG